jgi:predicted 2-oxoglutarate/Fe(II)-dependent dioxygenase YbiX
VLEPALITRLLEFWERSDKIENAISAGAAGDEYARDTIKRRADVHIHDPALKEALLDRLKRRLLPEIYKTFRSKIASYEDFRIGCYEDANQGEFRRHRDNITANTAHRRFALSINLNAGYEGGTLRFPEFGRTLYRPRPGGAVVFSCALLHEVHPVTRGRRFVLLSFLNDAEGLKAEKAQAAKASAKAAQTAGKPKP